PGVEVRARAGDCAAARVAGAIVATPPVVLEIAHQIIWVINRRGRGDDAVEMRCRGAEPGGILRVVVCAAGNPETGRVGQEGVIGDDGQTAAYVDANWEPSDQVSGAEYYVSRVG